MAQRAIDPASEVVILDGIPSDSGVDNAGCMAFGPDGMLYVSTGDGGEFHDHAQALDSLSGKILLFVLTGSIPDDNPFTDVPEARPGNLEPRLSQSVALHLRPAGPAARR